MSKLIAEQSKGMEGRIATDTAQSACNGWLCDFEKWLRKVCFQKPTQEAYDLAKSAWKEARETAHKAGYDLAIKDVTNMMNEMQVDADIIRNEFGST